MLVDTDTAIAVAQDKHHAIGGRELAGCRARHCSNRSRVACRCQISGDHEQSRGGTGTVRLQVGIGHDFVWWLPDDERGARSRRFTAAAAERFVAFAGGLAQAPFAANGHNPAAVVDGAVLSQR